MFEENRSPEEESRPEPPSIEEGGAEEGREEEGGAKEGGPSEIYTMPDKFVRKEGKGTKGRVSKPLIIILLIVIFAGVAFGAVILFNRLSEPEENVNAVLNIGLNKNLNENANVNANLNANLSLNTNLDANVNANANVNENVNLNANLNANVNANTNVNANANTNVSITPLPSSTDIDSDGLTDIEEALYGTGVSSPDTDGDGYIDGKQVKASGDIVGELYLGYDPTTVNTRLENTNLVKRYTNSTYNWSMLYPTKWTATVSSSATGDKSIMFSPDISTVEYIQVSVQENPTRLSAKNWYLSLNPGISSAQVESLVINGLDGVKSLDATTVYLSKQDKIYVISYNVGNLTSVNYQTTFEMMYQSFKLVSASTTNTNTNTNSNTNTNTNSNTNGS